DRNRSHWSTSKTPSYTKSVSWQHHPLLHLLRAIENKELSPDWFIVWPSRLIITLMLNNFITVLL
ncbi:hypothetical protein, partial [Escherichia coli]|uniref:hypothetical protein n=1 Tax=Escherichia coli TaxID=562 RepID=UPI0023B03C91